MTTGLVRERYVLHATPTNQSVFRKVFCWWAATRRATGTNCGRVTSCLNRSRFRRSIVIPSPRSSLTPIQFTEHFSWLIKNSSYAIGNFYFFIFTNFMMRQPKMTNLSVISQFEAGWTQWVIVNDCFWSILLSDEPCEDNFLTWTIASPVVYIKMLILQSKK